MTLYEHLTERIEAEEVNAARIAAGREPLPDYMQPAIDICRYKADAIRDTRDFISIQAAQAEV